CGHSVRARHPEWALCRGDPGLGGCPFGRVAGRPGPCFPQPRRRFTGAFVLRPVRGEECVVTRLKERLRLLGAPLFQEEGAEAGEVEGKLRVVRRMDGPEDPDAAPVRGFGLFPAALHVERRAEVAESDACEPMLRAESRGVDV